VQVYFNTAVQRVESSVLHAEDQRCEADVIIVAGGDDYQTLFPGFFRDSAVNHGYEQHWHDHVFRACRINP